MYKINHYVWMDDEDCYTEGSFYVDPKSIVAISIKNNRNITLLDEVKIKAKVMEFYLSSGDNPDIYLPLDTPVEQLVADITRMKDYIVKLKGA